MNSLALPEMPLWLFGLLTAIVFELLVPLFGVVMAYVYGEHVARHEELSDSRVPSPVG